ncbi:MULTISPECIES: DUF1109 domain-containing protein [Cupriavidus]
MKTDDFVALLATGIKPADRHVALKAFTLALAGGTAGAMLLMAAVFGVRPDLAQVMALPVFWLKVAFPLGLAAAALLVLNRLMIPGAAVGLRWAAPALPVLAVWIGAVAILADAAQAEQAGLILGRTWRTCPFNITLLSLPLFAGIQWAIRQMAPTRLRAAGAMGGLLAGATATLVYCLHCPEMEVPFWAVWYLGGMLIPAAVGGIVGPRILRW